MCDENCYEKKGLSPRLCYIPGPTGPRGAPGTSPVSVFGRKFDDSVQNINLLPDTSFVIPISNNGDSSLINIDVENTLTITQDGNYKIDYFFSGISHENANITVEVKQNDEVINGTSIVRDTIADATTDFVGSTIAFLSAGDNISISITSTSTVTISPVIGTNAYLNIYRL